MRLPCGRTTLPSTASGFVPAFWCVFVCVCMRVYVCVCVCMCVFVCMSVSLSLDLSLDLSLSLSLDLATCSPVAGICMPPRMDPTTDTCDAGVHLLCLQVNVANVDLRSTMLGHGVKMPVYISSCALGRLAHPDGELCLTRAAATCGVVQLWPTLASCTLDEMDQVRTKDQVLFLQLYVNHDRKVCQPLSPPPLSPSARARARVCVCVCVASEAKTFFLPPTSAHTHTLSTMRAWLLCDR